MCRNYENPANVYHNECFRKVFPNENVNDIPEPSHHNSAELPVMIHKPIVSQKFEKLTEEQIQAVREKRLTTTNQMKTDSNTTYPGSQVTVDMHFRRTSLKTFLIYSYSN
jgi:hypothetical protein